MATGIFSFIIIQRIGTVGSNIPHIFNKNAFPYLSERCPRRGENKIPMRGVDILTIIY